MKNTNTKQSDIAAPTSHHRPSSPTEAGSVCDGVFCIHPLQTGKPKSNFRLATRPGDFPLLACFRSTQFECLTDGTDMEDRVKRVFKDVWGFEVRPDQLKAVLAALEGKDVFVGMATGKGKSLCFQSIPLCLTEPKLVVVVSPLGALVSDQIHRFQTATGYKGIHLKSAADIRSFREIPDKDVRLDLDRAEAQLLQFGGAFEALYEAPNRNRRQLIKTTYTVYHLCLQNTLPQTGGNSVGGTPTQDDEWLTISLTRLTMEDRQQLLGQWLSKKHICDQHLLKEEFPLVDGFRDTNFSSCRPVPAMAECIQMHHIGDHWAVSCTQEIKTGVSVYGSMYTTVGIGVSETKISDRRTPTLTSQWPSCTDATICRLDDRSSPIISIRSDIWRLVNDKISTKHQAGDDRLTLPTCEWLLGDDILQKVEEIDKAGKTVEKVYKDPKPDKRRVKDGTWRPVVNLKPLNQYVVADHFKMEGTKKVQSLLQPNDWMATLDIKDAYFHQST
ncbi:hypothetical protein Bbelb_047910 [Branchiostoma belcheri]|nr:hypothetical protein Bbelb_047910 [Branchiostoma belcheri]